MAITNGYASLAQVKAALRIPTSDTQDDTLLELCIESSSRQIDGYTQRIFYPLTATTRVYTPQSAVLVEIDDLVTLTSLVTADDGQTFSTTWTASDYQLEPLNGKTGGISTPSTRIRAVGDYLFPVYSNEEATVRVTGTFGFSAAPTDIVQATVLMAMRQFKRYDSPLGVAGFGDMGAMRVSRFDPDIEAMVAPWRKYSIG